MSKTYFAFKLIQMHDLLHLRQVVLPLFYECLTVSKQNIEVDMKIQLTYFIRKTTP